MLQIDLITRFLGSRRIAVVGVSRKKDLPANYIFEKLKAAAYQAIPINPHAKEIGGEACYPSIIDTPDKPEAVLLAGSPEVSEKVVDDCVEIGVPLVWMHRGVGPGSFSKKAAQRCDEKGIDVITNGCPMMFIQPVDPFHKLLRWIKRF